MAHEGGYVRFVGIDQQKVVQFKSHTSTMIAQWVILRTFHCRLPDYPIPQTRQRMLSHYAIEAWETLTKSDEWKRCQPR